MIVRPLDENGDMTPIYNVNQMIEGSEAVAQVIDLRLAFLYGEWWEDETLGFRVPEFLVGNARSGDVDLLAEYIASYVSNTEGVRSVTGVESVYSNHKMTFYCSVMTDDGEETVEVNVDGLL